MLYTVEGLVVGRRDIGESSCFLDILTDEMGLIEVSAKGVKKLGGRNLAASSLFSYSLFCVNKSKNNYSLNSSEPRYIFHKISENIVAFSLANYFNDVIKYCASSEEKQPDLLRLMLISLYKLEQTAIKSEKALSLAQIKAVFELRLMSQIGFLPELRICGFCGVTLNDKMKFYPLLGVVSCETCSEVNKLEDKIRINQSVFFAMRHIVFSYIDKIFAFVLSKENMNLLAGVCEIYLLNQVGRSFKTLDYYKNMVIKGNRNE